MQRASANSPASGGKARQRVQKPRSGRPAGWATPPRPRRPRARGLPPRAPQAASRATASQRPGSMSTSNRPPAAAEAERAVCSGPRARAGPARAASPVGGQEHDPEPAGGADRPAPASSRTAAPGRARVELAAAPLRADRAWSRPGRGRRYGGAAGGASPPRGALQERVTGRARGRLDPPPAASAPPRRGCATRSRGGQPRRRLPGLRRGQLRPQPVGPDRERQDAPAPPSRPRGREEAERQGCPPRPRPRRRGRVRWNGPKKRLHRGRRARLP